jgi:hypothetical protein
MALVQVKIEDPCDRATYFVVTKELFTKQTGKHETSVMMTVEINIVVVWVVTPGTLTLQ